MICKTCKLDKDLNCYYFNKIHQSYRLSCKECVNNKRNETYKQKRGDKFYYPYSKEKKKNCSKCHILKDLNENNFFRNASKFRNICIICTIDDLDKRKELSKIRNRPNHLITAYRSYDLKRQRSTTVTKEFLVGELLKPCIYCEFPSTGLDRIDNDIGHTIENSLPCCKECNTARNRNFSVEEMKLIGKAIREIKISRINKQ